MSSEYQANDSHALAYASMPDHYTSSFAIGSADLTLSGEWTNEHWLDINASDNHTNYDTSIGFAIQPTHPPAVPVTQGRSIEGGLADSALEIPNLREVSWLCASCGLVQETMLHTTLNDLDHPDTRSRTHSRNLSASSTDTSLSSDTTTSSCTILSYSSGVIEAELPDLRGLENRMALIERLYIQEGLTLKKVVAVLKNGYRNVPQPRTLKRWLHNRGIRKNTTGIAKKDLRLRNLV